MISDKVRPHHLERKALLCVRQSSAHQVLHNRESSALQYAMRDRLAGLGWSEIEIIDDDLGRSAAGGVQLAFAFAAKRRAGILFQFILPLAEERGRDVFHRGDAVADFLGAWSTRS